MQSSRRRGRVKTHWPSATIRIVPPRSSPRAYAGLCDRADLRLTASSIPGCDAFSLESSAAGQIRSLGWQSAGGLDLRRSPSEDNWTTVARTHLRCPLIPQGAGDPATRGPGRNCPGEKTFTVADLSACWRCART